MNTLLIIALVVAMGATGYVLVRGVIAMANGKDATGQVQQNYMQKRVLYQGIAIMLVVLYLTHGLSTTTTIAVVGTLASLAITAVLAAVATAGVHLTGVADETSNFLTITQGDVNMRGLLLAGIVIGSLGVLDDVTVTQSATVSELAVLGLPSVLVPYPVGNGEQKVNAHDLVEAGAAVLVDDARFTPSFVADELRLLLADRPRIEAMASAAGKVGIADGAARLAELIQRAVSRA
jgi:hypothetical protein